MLTRKGRFEQAHGGTLLLDEISEMPLALQAKLLRVIQEKEILPIGAAESTRVDVRIISASNQPLPELVEAGRFRQDLFFRLNVLPVNLPPLRERQDDVPQLVMHFLDLLCHELGKERMEIDPEVIEAFCRFS